MKPAHKYYCEVCGTLQKGNDWFLLAEDRGRDTLQILKWNGRLAADPSMRHLCTAAHVERLVCHWMLTGSLDYGWSRAGSVQGREEANSEDVDGAFRLGELMLDRASFSALGENPDMLNSILDAIDVALQAAAEAPAGVDEEQEEEEPTPVYDA